MVTYNTVKLILFKLEMCVKQATVCKVFVIASSLINWEEVA